MFAILAAMKLDSLQFFSYMYTIFNYGYFHPWVDLAVVCLEIFFILNCFVKIIEHVLKMFYS